jgi:hypothetical protein
MTPQALRSIQGKGPLLTDWANAVTGWAVAAGVPLGEVIERLRERPAYVQARKRFLARESREIEDIRADLETALADMVSAMNERSEPSGKAPCPERVVGVNA